MAAAAKERDLVFSPRFVLHLPRILGAFIVLAFYLATARADHTGYDNAIYTGGIPK